MIEDENKIITDKIIMPIEGQTIPVVVSISKKNGMLNIRVSIENVEQFTISKHFSHDVLLTLPFKEFKLPR